MSETVETLETPTEPRSLASDHPRRKFRIKPKEVAIVAAFVIIIVLLVGTIINRLQLKHKVTSAEVVTNQVIADLGKRDGAAAYSLGSSKFKSTFTASQLTQQFHAIELVTGGKPVIDTQAASSGKAGNTVVVIYKYPKKLAGQPFFVAIVVTQPKGGHTWQLTNISGSADESKLGF